MGSNWNGTTDSLFGFHSERSTYLIVVPISICTVSFDIFTIHFLIRCRRLRKVHNYPIVSLMLGALIQDLLATPLYLFRYLHAKYDDSHFWICSTYRFAYFLSGHTMKVSLLIVSFDRLYSIRNSLNYKKMITRKNMLVVLLGTWIFITIIDIMPFYMKKETKEQCIYVPTHQWGVAVITLFNNIPFVLLCFNYVTIWKIAFKKELRQRKLRDSISSLPNITVNGVPTDQSFPLRKIRSVDDYENYRIHGGLHEMEDFRPTLSKTASKTSTLTFALELRATRSALAFAGVYILCWGPMAVFYLVDNISKNRFTDSQERSHVIARFVIKMISFASSPLAPLVYIWRSKLFREEVQKRFCRKRFRAKKRKALKNVLG